MITNKSSRAEYGRHERSAYPISKPCRRRTGVDLEIAHENARKLLTLD